VSANPDEEEDPTCPECEECMEWYFEGELNEETGRIRRTAGCWICVNPDCEA
jgi:hypothetical protein